MNRTMTSALLAAVSTSLGGCVGLTQMQDSAGKFDTSAHGVVAAQEQLYSQLQTLDCKSQALTQAIQWSFNKSANFDVKGTCTLQVITNDQLKTRTNLLNAIALYADQLQALVSSSKDATLSTDSQTLAKNLNDLATNHSLNLVSSQSAAGFTSISSDVEAGIIAITNLIIDKKRASDAKSAATNMETPLNNVVTRLKVENILDAESFPSNGAVAEVDLRAYVAQAPRGVASFDALTKAQQIYQGVNPFFSTADGISHYPTSDTMNAALDALVKANSAIAEGQKANIVAAVSDFIARANAALQMENSLNSTSK